MLWDFAKDRPKEGSHGRDGRRMAIRLLRIAVFRRWRDQESFSGFRSFKTCQDSNTSCWTWSPKAFVERDWRAFRLLSAVWQWAPKGFICFIMEAIALRVEAIASRLEAIALRVEAIARGWKPSLLGWKFILLVTSATLVVTSALLVVETIS